MNKEKKLWNDYRSMQKDFMQKDESFSLGPYHAYHFRKTPRHILFLLARYKFAMKMIGLSKTVLELGCNEGLGTYYLSEFAKNVLGVDFDEEAIQWAKRTLSSDKLSFKYDNFMDKKYGEYDAVVSYDVIEHIYRKGEKNYFETVKVNLKKTGIFLIGTPNIEASRFESPETKTAHINLYSGDRLIETLNEHFSNVFLFSQNDEVIHTGFVSMSHYLIGLCCCKKDKRYG